MYRRRIARPDDFDDVSTSNTRDSVVATLVRVLECLDRERVRATYGAVGEVLQLPAQSVGLQLRNHAKQSCWVVSTRTGKPTGHSDTQTHPEFFSTRIIDTGAELLQLLGAAEENDHMTSVFANDNICWSCRNMTSHATGQTLHEVRESRRRQDAKLQAFLRAATVTIILFVAIMAVVTTASGEFASWFAVSTFPVITLLFVTLALMADHGRRWNDEPEITESRFVALSKHLKPQDTDLYLIDIHIKAFKQNKQTLRYVLFWFWGHNLIAFSGVVLAMKAL